MTAKLDPAAAYAGIPLRLPGPWWRRWLSAAALSCLHSGTIQLDPDRIQLRTGAMAVRQPSRPPITVCADCLLRLLEPELRTSDRRVIAFEPAEGLTTYTFLEQDHLGDAPLSGEDVIHCQSLVAEPLGGCQKCGHPAVLLLVKRGSMTERGKLASFRGGKEYYCAAHGSERLLGLLRERLVGNAPVKYFNFPYGERGVYIPTE